MLSLRRFLVALFATGLVFGVYALVVAPWLEPPAVEKPPYNPSRDQFLTAVNLRNFKDLFAEESWELDDPKVIETASCTVLLKDYKPLPDGRMEIMPCTLIFYMAPAKDTVAKPGGKDPRRPVVMRALDGAILTFDRPLDLGNAEFGRIVAGQLRGAIQIRSPETVPGRSNDALSVDTKGVQIDRQKIYTPQFVDFKYGSSFGRGRDLTITLQPASEDKKDRVQSLGGISYLQLSQVERLHLEGASGFLQSPGKVPAQKAQPPKVEPPLEVSCQGPLIVDFDNGQARLDEHVEVKRIHEQGPPDKLTCDRLLFRLKASGGRKPPDPSATAKTKKNPGAASSPPETGIERIIAIGTPAVIDAPQSQLYAKAASMDYTLASRVVRLSNGPTGAPVILRLEKNRFEARGIDYEAAEAGHLGKLFAAGPGELELVQASGETVQATWKKSLHIRPDQGSQAVSLLEGAHVSAGSMGTFDAAEMHLWLKEIPRPTKAPVKGPGNSRPSFSLIPERMLAVSNVEVDSPQIHANTNRLEAWFVEPPREQPAAVPVGGEQIPGFQRLPADEANPKTGPTQKLSVKGKLIQMQLLRLPGKPAVEDLAITGNVEVEEVQTERPGDVPLKLSGDAVTIVRGSGPNAKLEVKGRPAQVSARGLTLSGATIHLHRGENRLWIDGPGEAELPVPVEGLQMRSLQPPGENPVSAPAQFPAAKGAETRPVKVTWESGMNFDGLKVSFEGKVQVRGEGEYAAAETLDVTLTERLDFSAAKQAGTAEIATITLTGNKSPVILQQITRDKAGEQSSFDNLRSGKLTIDRQANTLTGEGPGEVWSVRKDAPPPMPQPGEPPPKPTDGKLTYICVKFAGGINGKLDKRELRFERQVETTYGRVNDWKDRLIATKSEDLGLNGAFMKSEALTVTEMSLSKAQKWVELEATGNVLVEGKSFTAQAARIGYTTDKEQLVMEGDGRNDAKFWHQAAPGTEYSHVAAGKITFQRKTGTIEVGDGKTGTISLGSLPPSKVPLPRKR